MINKLFNKPKVIGIAADVNQGKSMLLYHLLDQLQREYDFSVYAYGLRMNMKQVRNVYSVAEIESIRDSIIIVDELSSLFDLDNRKQKKIIENTLRLINHNNNVLILCGTPENFKKFLGAKVDIAIFKKCTISDFINGSRMKNLVLSYRGNERGSELLNMDIGEALLYDGEHYEKIKTPYLPQFDTKRDNVSILRKRAKNVPKNVLKTYRRE